jgi:hypothetical protein
LKPIFDRFSILSRALSRSEAQMAINHIQNAFFAANSFGKGIANVAGGWQAVASRAASALEAFALRGLSIASGYWYALSLKRMPATATPTATCRTIISDRRRQRHQRWMSGVVVVDPGTVGVS